jgi:SRSO17 transposase
MPIGTRGILGVEKERGTMPLSELTESIFEYRRFVRRYERLFGHKARRRYVDSYLRGLIGPLERKSIEPIALDQGVDMRRLQEFVGSSPWDAETILAEHRRHVRETFGSPNGILIIDPTSFPKRGDKSVGVARQWCGQLGKEENCVVGVHLAYASEKGHTPVDRRLYLPKTWSEDPVRRRSVGIPRDVVFRKSWELAYEMISYLRREGFPHAWITGDEEFGKVPLFRDWLNEDGERYILEVPCRVRVWVTLPRRRIRGPGGVSRRLRARGPGRPQLVRVDELARRLSSRAWSDHEVRDASKGPIRVRAALIRVLFHRSKERDRREGWLLITRALDQTAQVKYFQSNGAPHLSKEELLGAGFARWPVEQCHGQGKNETGLGDYETRSWLGWHHHTALSFLAHHWLVLERNRLGEKISRDDSRGSAASLLFRLTDGTPNTSELEAPDATPTTSQSECASVALEEEAGPSSDTCSAEADRSRSNQIGHSSIVQVKTAE